ncbi:ThiF family adenylyltransferase [Sorangium sp. So ce1099]|uniref:ThiF family adenylyltransferase n=1 Tax=Sorangium sp. So ce1099 TaxID=3133331 RepID=UPI003F60D055
MIGARDRHELLEALVASGKLGPARVMRTDELAWGKARSVGAAAEGHVEIGGRGVALRVGLCARFPLALPQIFVVLPETLGALPHVEHDGRICYRSSEGLLLDHRAPLLILEEAVDAAIQTVAAGVSGANWLDFLDELEAYWRQLTGADPLPCYVEPDDRLRRIDVGRSSRGKPAFIADSFAEVRAFWNGRSATHVPLSAAHYVPLTSTVLEERFNPRQLLSQEWARAFVLRHLSRENLKEFERLGSKDFPRALVTLGVPRPSGGKGLIALDYHEVTGGNPLLHGTTRQPVRVVAVDRRDRAVIVARSVGALHLSKRRVALVGCGAVGGHLALLLARAGVRHLTLIDPDKLTAGNTLRHVLGHSAIGTPKVDAMKQEIAGKVPYMEIELHRKRIEQLLQSREIDLGKIDLLLYAAGDPTVGLYVNEQMHRATSAPALLLTWLEPHGIGGHALLANTLRAGARGCFECLFDSPLGEGERRNRADFAGPDQHFAKDVSGCATMYTPYADLDAARTAELAARLALDFLQGREVGHPLLSWKGDGSAFRAAGFRTSDRHELGETQLHGGRFDYVREACVVCGCRP